MTEPVPDELLWSWVDRDAAELAEHLRRHPEDQARVDALRQQIDGIAQAGGGAARLPEWIGPYRVTGFLGAGAMGVVYAARQQRPDREVAIKVLRHAQPGDVRQRARFEREAAALGRLRHPAIATIYEAGVADDGTPYLVMERVRGRPLLEYVARAGLDRRRRLELFAAIGDGVQAAHSAEVVHRDLKPGNILVDEQGQPRIVDFGLARLMDDEAPLLAQSVTGFAGTLPYMSPEQLDGTLGPVDAGSDVYALGVILYELLLARLPHALAGLPLSTVIHRVCNEPPARPRALEASMPRDLEAVVLQALSPMRAHRYRSAADLAADVRRHLRGEPVLAGPPRLASRLRRAARRHRRELLAFGVVLLAGIAALGWWRSGNAVPSGPSIAGLPAHGPIELAPFASLRWRGESPQIERDGQWRDLVGIAGRPIAAVLAAAKARDPADFRAVVRRDLVRLLRELAPDTPVDAVSLETLADGAVERAEVPLTRIAWQALRAQQEVVQPLIPAGSRPGNRDTAAFSGVRYPDDRVEVLHDGSWCELERLAGLPVAELRRRALALPDIRDEEHFQKRFAEDLAWLMGRLGYDVNDSVAARLRDLSGGTVTDTTVTLTHDKRRQLMDNR